MATKILENFPVKIDINALKKNLRIKDDDERFEELEDMVTQAINIAKPKVVYKEAFVDEITDESVIIDGIYFKSRVMRSNLENVGRVFACIFTSGSEIDEWSKGFTDMMDKFLADSINESTLHGVGEYLFNHLNDVFELGKLGWMSPGSLPDWPVNGQADIFSLIGNVEEMIGVRLTKRFMLSPMKSVAGIIFPSDISYVNCMLCKRDKCKSRRAPFDAQLYKEKLG